MAEATAELERRVRIPLYARAGVQEMWLVDLGREEVEVYREPTPEGYLSVRVVRRGERTAHEAFPDRPVAVSDLLPALEGGVS